MNSLFHALVLTSAGSSMRFKNGKKEFHLINGKSVLFHAALPFVSTEGLKAVVVTYKEGTLEQTKKALEGLPASIPLFFTPGGKTRRESVLNGLRKLNECVEDKNILVSIHDGARPFASTSLVKSCLETASVYGAAVPALKGKDTLALVEDSIIKSYIDREKTVFLQTPQVFILGEILLSHEKAAKEGRDFTDDTSLFTEYGGCVHVVPGEAENTKITFPEDMEKYR